MTAPERWPERDDLDRDALVRQIHDQRRQHVARLDAARHERFLDLRPAVVLAVLVFELRRAGGGSAVRSWPCATQATGNVRLHVTGRPPTTSEFAFFCAQPNMPSGRVAAARP